MANIKLVPTGVYAVVDMEYVSAELSGAGIYAQELELDATNFASIKAENGMAVKIEGNKVKLPAVGDAVKLFATECEIFEEGKGRETFAVDKAMKGKARAFNLVGGDTISTNAAFYDDTEFSTLAALKTAIGNGTVKAIPDATGLWKLSATTTGAKVIGEVLAYVTLSNNRDGVRIRF